MANANTSNLTEAFYNSLQYFLKKMVFTGDPDFSVDDIIAGNDSGATAKVTAKVDKNNFLVTNITGVFIIGEICVNDGKSGTLSFFMGVDTVLIANPTISISSLTPPFILIRPWDHRQAYFVMPDDEREHEHYFDIWVSCASFAQQRVLPLTVIRECNKATALDADGTTRDGIQVYTEFDSSTGKADPNSKLCAADILLSAARAFEITTEEEKNRKYMDIISGYWWVVKDKDKAFLTT